MFQDLSSDDEMEEKVEDGNLFDLSGSKK